MYFVFKFVQKQTNKRTNTFQNSSYIQPQKYIVVASSAYFHAILKANFS